MRWAGIPVMGRPSKWMVPSEWGEESGEGAEGGCLSCAVGADEGDDLSGVDGEGDSFDGFDFFP
ncbi:hypothetical protein GCM10020000_61300 [Streptomyces olivoverticillatus]